MTTYGMHRTDDFIYLSLRLEQDECFLDGMFDSAPCTMATKKVKTNSNYQKQMDKSFAVIFHNLKRIQDNKPLQEHKHCSQPEIPNPEASRQLGRHPVLGSHSLTHERPCFEVKERSYSVKEVSKSTKCRRASFSVDSVTSSSP